MKHLLGAIAMAALIGAVPAWAQTSATDPSKQPMPEAGASGQAHSSAIGASSESGTTMSKAHHRTATRGGRSPEDNMAEELNRQELDRVMQNGGEGAGTSTPAAPGTVPDAKSKD